VHLTRNSVAAISIVIYLSFNCLITALTTILQLSRYKSYSKLLGSLLKISNSAITQSTNHFYLEFLHSEKRHNNGNTRYNRCPSFSLSIASLQRTEANLKSSIRRLIEARATRLILYAKRSLLDTQKRGISVRTITATWLARTTYYLQHAL